jgi:hypothetical protein
LPGGVIGEYPAHAGILPLSRFQILSSENRFSSRKILSDAGFVEGIKIGIRLRTELTEE